MPPPRKATSARAAPIAAQLPVEIITDKKKRVPANSTASFMGSETVSILFYYINFIGSSKMDMALSRKKEVCL
jgi:hypothetical protein